MRLLWVVTKAPWPATDGGKVVIASTLEALRDRGHEIDLVAPYDPERGDARAAAASLTPLCRPHLVPVARRSLLRAALSSARSGMPLSIARHSHPAVRAEVERVLRGGEIDVVHAEQLQAVAQCAPAHARGVPVVLRSQNVESDLWHGWTRHGAWRGAVARPLAARLAAFEARTLCEASAVIALTAPDAQRLATLAGDAARITHVAAPFPAELPAGAALPPARPAVAVLASGGWAPNRDGVAWLVREVWPRVRTLLPEAVLHLFGELPARHGATSGMLAHPAPDDSRDAFPAGAICVVPLRYGSGVRIRVLEAWARGLPVVATPAAVHGLDARDGRELLVAATADQFAAALRTLDGDQDVRARLIEAGRARLRATHDPDAIAARLEQVYRDALRAASSGAQHGVVRQVRPGVASA